MGLGSRETFQRHRPPTPVDARRWGKNDALEIKHFFQRLSVALQRGNAALLINKDADLSDT